MLQLRKLIICVDDLERLGKTLDVGDVMGFISLLKEQRRCKVAVILNEEALSQHKLDFDKYFEKALGLKKLVDDETKKDNLIAIADKNGKVIKTVRTSDSD